MAQYKVLLNGNSQNFVYIEIDNREGSPQQIGKGGQSLIFGVEINGEHKAAKMFVLGTPKGQLQARLLALLKLGHIEGVLMPEHIILDDQNRLCGYIMPRIPKGYHQLRQALEAEQRVNLGLRWIIDIFIALYILIARLHKHGIILGDISPNNIFVNPSNTKVLIIDVDSLQFGAFPCPVGTEATLHPSLYGKELHLKPTYSEETDWYGFAVLFFGVLFGSLPFMGSYPDPTMKEYTDRAKAGIWILDPRVRKTKSFINVPITEKLKEVFERYFVKGELFTFPKTVILAYKKGYREVTIDFVSKPGGNSSYEVSPLFITKNPLIYSRSTQRGIIGISLNVDTRKLYVTRYLILNNQVWDDTLLPVEFEEGMKFEYFDRFLLIVTATHFYVVDVTARLPSLIDTINRDNGIWCVSGGTLFTCASGIVISTIYHGGRQTKVIGKVRNKTAPLAMHPPKEGTSDSVVLIYRQSLHLVKEGDKTKVIPLKLGVNKVNNLVADYPLQNGEGPLVLRLQGEIGARHVVKTFVVDLGTQAVVQREEDFDTYPAKLVPRCYNGKYLILIGDLGVYREEVQTGERPMILQTLIPQMHYFPFGKGMAIQLNKAVELVTTGKKA